MMGGPYGDLFLHISVARSREFERIKNDIYTQQHIHLLQAVLGDKIKVKTVYGDVDLVIPAGTETGTRLIIKDHGVPKVGTSAKGDHHIKIFVDIPKKLSGQERKQYEELVKLARMDIKAQKKGLFS